MSISSIKYKSEKNSFLTSKSTLLPIYEYLNNIKRFQNYEKIIQYLENIKLNKNTCLTVKNNNNYLLGNSLLLYKKIGTESVYGVIFKCKNVNPRYQNIPIFTIKIQMNTNALRRETNIFIKLSNYGLSYKIPNLPILYKVIECSQNIPKTIIKKNDKAVDSVGYTMLINELAAGDLRTFLSSYARVIDDRLWRNIYAQVFISLAILHSLGIKHNDAHDGNFLYHKINPGGCFHYRIDDTDFYIENLGFLWTSWDYGLIKKIKSHGDYIYDYMLINICMRKNNYTKKYELINHDFYHSYEWGYLNSYVNVPSTIETLQNKLWDLLGGVNNNNDIYIIKTKKMSEPLFLKTILNKGLFFSKKPIGNVISSVNITFPTFDIKSDSNIYNNSNSLL